MLKSSISVFNSAYTLLRRMSASTIPNRIAVGQMTATNNKNETFKQVSAIVGMAKKNGASFLFLPEACDYVGTSFDESLQLAESAGGQLFGQYQELAKSNSMWISFGGIHEAINDKNDIANGNKMCNNHIIINSSGTIVASYHKLHLFDVACDTFTVNESDYIRAGDRLVAPIETPIGRLGLQICYDLRFPETSLLLKRLGAQIITYPSAFLHETGAADHWQTLLRARAIECQVFVIAAAQAGFHHAKRRSYGHAMIIDPWGRILADAGACDDENTPKCVFADIDLSEIDRCTQKMPIEKHKRSDIYHLELLATSNRSIPIERCEAFRFADHEVPACTIFCESDYSIAFTNIRCVVVGHVLVASKRCVPHLSDLSSAESGDMFELVRRVQRTMSGVYQTKSTTITIQDGPEAGQTVPHVHCHIMPRRIGDFERNDDIYGELDRHDRPDVETPIRSIQERINEVKIYKKYMIEHNL